MKRASDLLTATGGAPWAPPDEPVIQCLCGCGKPADGDDDVFSAECLAQPWKRRRKKPGQPGYRPRSGS